MARSEIEQRNRTPLGGLFGDIGALDLANPTARTATANGLTTGLIASGTKVVEITAADANHWVTLPDPVVGDTIYLHVGANGCEVRTSAPATIGINGGTGATAEMALAANVAALAICVSSTNWVILKFSAVEAAA